MPILTVHGIQSEFVPELAALKANLKRAASSIPQFKLEEKDIVVNLVPDLLGEVIEAEEVVVFIDLFPRDERTPELLELMQQKVAGVLRSSFTGVEICCYVRPLDPRPKFSFVLPAAEENRATSKRLT